MIGILPTFHFSFPLCLPVCVRARLSLQSGKLTERSGQCAGPGRSALLSADSRVYRCRTYTKKQKMKKETELERVESRWEFVRHLSARNRVGLRADSSGWAAGGAPVLCRAAEEEKGRAHTLATFTLPAKIRFLAIPD